MTEQKATATAIAIAIYQAPNGAIEFRGDYEQETIWGTQRQIAELFGVDVRAINEHLINIYNSEELKESSTLRKYRIVQKEGNRDFARLINFYNLDAILSVGYRVNSKQATQFRIWATQILKQLWTAINEAGHLNLFGSCARQDFCAPVSRQKP